MSRQDNQNSLIKWLQLDKFFDFLVEGFSDLSITKGDETALDEGHRAEFLELLKAYGKEQQKEEGLQFEDVKSCLEYWLAHDPEVKVVSNVNMDEGMGESAATS